MLKTRNLAVMFTDIKGFTQSTSDKTRRELLELLDRHREIVLPVAESHGGHLVKTIGDAFLLTFDSPTNAVLAGIEAQDRLREHNADQSPGQHIEIRVAINVGEVTLTDDGDVYGEAVNIASRIEGLAEAGEVFFTEAVYLSMNKREVPSSEIGYRQLKGVPEKIKVYKVLKEVPPGAPEELKAAPEASSTPVEAVAAAAPAEPAPSAVEPALAPALGEIRPAGFWIRLVAILIDSLIVSLVFGAFFELISEQPPGVRIEKVRKPALPDVPAVPVIPGATGSVPGVPTPPVPPAPPSPPSGFSLGGDGLTVRDDGNQIDVGLGGLRLESADGKVLAVGADGFKASKPSGKEIRIDGGGLVASNPEGADDYDYMIFGLSGPERLRAAIEFLVWVLYCSLFWTFWGATPGKKALGLVVVRSEDGERPEYPRALLRAAFYFISGIVLGLGFLWAVFSKNKLTWHDRVAGTRVVRKGERG